MPILGLRNGYDFLDKYCDGPLMESMGPYDIYHEISTKIFDYRIKLKQEDPL